MGGHQDQNENNSKGASSLELVLIVRGHILESFQLTLKLPDPVHDAEVVVQFGEELWLGVLQAVQTFSAINRSWLRCHIIKL